MMKFTSWSINWRANPRLSRRRDRQKQRQRKGLLESLLELRNSILQVFFLFLSFSFFFNSFFVSRCESLQEEEREL